jgi:hypothetical protein
MRIVTSLLLALVAVLVWLSFVGMASPAIAQGGPLPIPSGAAVLGRRAVFPGAFSGRVLIAENRARTREADAKLSKLEISQKDLND